MKSSALRKKGSSSLFVSLLLPSIIVSPISANSCAELDDDPKKSDRQKKRGAGVTTIPTTARDLLQRAPTLETTLAKEFGKWQTSLKKEQQQQQQQQGSGSTDW
eukprot:CAMPEP_0202478868 /NCGR_PEP_ID=MMETSP1360-20130828/94683_1 /ASSEMBLY_ACC=CAM_ASM_000848 /TAXON_ID=515479 /ORGANISM="Licmophora paradoxa, Strain CCMP2313" /LENGTH=103 /DNA_ID=CAMNT_0049106165 /DNA_START=132 /DNA_END=440 /DNA_ORIENTATION=-